MSSSLDIIASAVPTLRSADTSAAAIGHVLVCLDRSAFADSCLPWARFVAEAFRARITLLHVLPSPPLMHGPSRSDALDWEVAQREASQYLAQVKDAIEGASAHIDTRLEQGAPARRIVAVGREPDVDLTILSAHGEGGDSAPDVGSIAQHVLAFAAGSVLLAQPTASGHIPPRRILVPLDGSLRSESILPIVAGLAKVHGAELILVHIVKDPTPTAILCDLDDIRVASSLASRIEANAEAYLARIRTRLSTQVPAIRAVVLRRPEERQALLDLARSEQADLVAITAHGSTCNIECVFGSVASHVLRHSAIATFVLQDLPRGQRQISRGSHVRQALDARPADAR